MKKPPSNSTEPTASQLLRRALDTAPSDMREWEIIEAEELNEMFDDRYTILSLLGRGGMGAVYRARDTRLDRDVAIKLLPAKLGKDLEMKARFEREAKSLAALDHPHIVHIYDFGTTDDGHLFIVMEFISGMNLVELKRSTSLELKHALEIISQVCSALQFAHDNEIIHRDIKPANILITSSGVVKVADFGLSRALNEEQQDFTLTITGAVMGTPDYMAPEQRMGETVDHRADIYAVGIMLYELLTGTPPRGAWTPPSEKEALDPRLDRVVIRAIQEDRTTRYQQASEVSKDIDTIHSTSGGAVLPKWTKVAALPSEIKNRKSQGALTGHSQRKSWLIAATVICVSLGLFLTFWNVDEERPSHEAAKNLVTDHQEPQPAKDRSHLNGLILSASLPPVDEGGHYTFFDGKTLYGVDPKDDMFDDPDSFQFKDGVITLKFSSLTFLHSWDTNSFFFKALVKKSNGENVMLGFKTKQDYEHGIYFNGVITTNTFGIGYKKDNDWKDIKAYECPREIYAKNQLNSFFDFLYIIDNHRHSIIVNSKGLCSENDPELSLIDGERRPFIRATRSTVLIKEIRIKPLHKDPLPIDPTIFAEPTDDAQFAEIALLRKLIVQQSESADIKALKTSIAKYLTLSPTATSYQYATLACRTAALHREAFELLERSAAKFPEDTWILLNYGIALQEKFRYKEAEKITREYLRLKPDGTNGWNNLGIILKKTKRFTEAAAAYKKSIELYPTSFHPHLNLALTYQQLGKINEAIESVQNALKIRPGEQAAKTLLHNLQHPDKPVIEANPIENAAQKVLALEIPDQQKLDQFLALQKQYPDSPRIHYLVGNYYLKTQQVDKAMATYEKVIELDKEHAMALCNLGGIYLDRKNLPLKALPYFERGHKAGIQQPNWRHPSAQWILNCKKAIAELDRDSQKNK